MEDGGPAEDDPDHIAGGWALTAALKSCDWSGAVAFRQRPSMKPR